MDTDNIYVPDEWEIERSKVTLGISLGQGSFGLVYEGEAKDLYNTDKKLRKVAIKTVTEPATIQDRINFLNEASRMKYVCIVLLTKPTNSSQMCYNLIYKHKGLCFCNVNST